MSVGDLRIGLSKGPRGESAYECAVRHGYVGTEEQWLASLEGKSAYQIAVELGYVGTEAEWIASLKGVKGDKGDPGKNGKDADVWTIGEDGFWYVNGKKTIFKSRGEDGKSPLLRISTDGQSLEISSDGGQTWLPFEKNFNKLRVIGYVDSVAKLPKNALVGDIYGVWNPDVYSGRVDEEGHLIKGAYDLYINTIKDWAEDYLITKVYDYDTELPSYATDGSTVLVPVSYLTLDKEKIDGYKVYRFSLEKDGWVMILNTAEIYASKDNIINYGNNVYALVQGDEEHTYKLYRRVVGWVFFGTNASITYKLIQYVEEGTTTNILSGQAVKNAIEEIYATYGEYTDNPEFLRVYLDKEGRILWGIKTDGSIFYGAGIPPQVKDYVDTKVKELSPEGYDAIVNFLDGIQFGDKTLQDLLNEKVDKEEGKSLIDEEYAEGIHYIENPEFVEVKLDQDDRILEAIMLDGTKLLPAGYKVGGNVVKTISNPEYLAAWLDSANHILFALKADGDVIFGCGIPSQIKKHVSELIEMFHYEDNLEFVDIKLDSKNKVLESIKNDGTKVLPAGVETPKIAMGGTIVESTNNPEYIDIKTDSKKKILECIRNDGTKVIGGNLEVLGSLDINGTVLKNTGNPEFLSIELDAEEKVLAGRRIDGTKFENAGLDLGGAVLKGVNDPEGRFEITKDKNGNLVSYRDFKGVKHENAGIAATTADVDSLNAKVADILRLNLTGDELKRIFRQNYIIINTNPSYGEVFIGENNNHMSGPTNTKNILIGMHNIQNASGYPDRNVAIGYHALFRGYEPKQSIAIGAESQDNVSYGVGNTAVGYSSLRCQRVEDYGGDSVVGETCQESTAFGFDCIFYVYGDHNTAIGAHALEGDTYGAKGNGNVAIGHSAGKYINDEDDTLFIDNRDRGSRVNEKAKALIFGKFADNIVDQFVKINGKFGCNGATPQPAVSANADATDLESAIALLNQIKNALISCGIMK